MWDKSQFYIIYISTTGTVPLRESVQVWLALDHILMVLKYSTYNFCMFCMCAVCLFINLNFCTYCFSILVIINRAANKIERTEIGHQNLLLHRERYKALTVGVLGYYLERMNDCCLYKYTRQARWKFWLQSLRIQLHVSLYKVWFCDL